MIEPGIFFACFHPAFVIYLAMNTNSLFRQNPLSLGPWIALFLGFGLLAVRGGAVPPAPGQEVRIGMKTCFVNRQGMERRVSAFRGSPALMGASPMPNPRVLVLRVQFADLSFGSTDLSAGFFQQVQDYFVENSYETFRPTFTISSIFSLPGTLATYGNNCGDNPGCNVPSLILAASAAANPSIHFNDYDQVMIYHAGYGEESTGRPSDIWSLFYPAEAMPEGFVRVDGHEFDGVMIVPERELGASALGVICHEYGHQLGLPDLYDISVPGGRSTAGAWDLMDYPFTGSPVGSNPPHLGAWSKRFLGFGATLSVSSGAVSLSPIELLPGQSLEIFGEGLDYFLLEYRLASAAGFDRFLPQAAGLAVWHVDKALTEDASVLNFNVVNTPSQNGFGHLGVDLIEADGTTADPRSGDPGRGNAFENGTRSIPMFSGVGMALVLSNVQGVGGPTASALINIFRVTNHQSIARAISYPNPAAGKTRVGAPSGTWSTFRVELTRPRTLNTFSANIYTLRGERVLELKMDDFSESDDFSDYSFIYEHDWNGRDDTGAEVASGVYYLVFDVEGEKVKTPFVLQR